jgi:hypothetical protein
MERSAHPWSASASTHPAGLDAYSTKVHGFTKTKVGQPFSNYGIANFWLD